MTLSKFSSVLLSYVLTGAFTVTIARADELDLRLDVEGYIQPLPTWRNEKWEIIDHLTFDFTRPADARVRHRDVDSDEAKARLVDTPKGFLTVSLTRPKGCSIGAGSIADQHVKFVHNYHVHSEDSDFDIRDQTLQTFAVRFSKEGGYGNLTGVVKCASPGILRYTYD